MSKQDNHIDIDRLNRYLNGEMSGVERNAIEKEALNNPFLAEAIEGLTKYPGSLEEFRQQHKKRFSKKRDYTLLIGISVLIGFFIISYTIKFEPRPGFVDVFKEKTISQELYIERDFHLNEVEQIPTAIDTLNTVDYNTIIPVDEIQRKQLDQAQKEEYNSPLESIDVEDPVIHEDEMEIIEEDRYHAGQVSLETIYMSDLMVVDYRVINRPNKKIQYMRLELTGTSASQENDNSTNDTWTESQVEVPYVNYLRKSMGFFAKGEHKKALSRYETILEQYPQDINAHFYGGLCYFNLGQYKKCITYFDSILQDEFHVFDEACLWYKSKALIQLEQTREAKALLLKIIARGGFYSEDAIQLSQKL